MFERISFDIDDNMDPYGQQENGEINDDRIEYSDNSDTDTFGTTEAQSADLGNTNSLKNQVTAVPDNIINENIRSFTLQQREVFDFVHKWSRDYIKSFGLYQKYHMQSGCWKVSCDKNHPYVIK